MKCSQRLALYEAESCMAQTLNCRRLVAMAVLLAIAFATLGYRLVDLQVVQHDQLRRQAERNTHQIFLLQPRRGEIRDRRGNVLASSLFVKTVCVDPTLIGGYQTEVARILSPLIEMTESNLVEKLQVHSFVDQQGQTRQDRHVVLKRKVPVETWERIQAAMKGIQFGLDEKKLNGKDRAFLRNLRQSAIYVESQDDQQRIYPNHTLAAHVLGFVSDTQRQTILGPVRDITGADGIELKMNSALSGVTGWRSTEVVRARELVTFRDQEVEAHSGRNVILTLDAGLQHIVESELAEVMQKHSPVSVSAVVIRPRTGEILALANVPTFDPNRAGDFPPAILRNRVIADVAEPGSTFKIVAVSGALNDGFVSLETRIDCENGRFIFAGRSLRDDHPSGILSVEDIIAKSSNIGTAKIAIQMGPARLYSYIQSYGFGSPTGIPLLGEVDGLVYPPKKWSKLSLSRIPIGQGIAITPLQMTLAMSAIANGGALMQPMLVDRVEDDQGQAIVQYSPQQVRRVISESTAAQMTAALKNVVSTNGTARRARLDRYSVAGKTGTAQKPGPGGYVPGKYYASFVGFFPADRPELCISVFLDEPKLPNYYGGLTAAPAFRSIAERAAKYLAIQPDLPPAEALALQGSRVPFASEVNQQ
ncbi:MAG: penicillin-binding protein 2 [Verrucomicrobia bacterium]|nr:penicillin-binding protein 2 [Verrucomicrobiota bacterium]